MNTVAILILSLFIIISILTIQTTILYRFNKIMLSLKTKKENTIKKRNLPDNVTIMNKYLRNCQHCKFRLSYIKIGDSSPEEFYYKCQISHENINLLDSCIKFEEDK